MSLVGAVGSWQFYDSGTVGNCTITSQGSCSNLVNKPKYGLASGQCGELFTSPLPSYAYYGCGSSPLTYVACKNNVCLAFQVIIESSSPDYISVIVYNPNGLDTTDKNFLEGLISIIATIADVSKDNVSSVLDPSQLGTNTNQWLNFQLAYSNPTGTYKDAPVTCQKQTSSAGINYIVCGPDPSSMAPGSQLLYFIFDDEGNPVPYNLYAQIFICNQPYSQPVLSNPASAVQGCSTYTQWGQKPGQIVIAIPNYYTSGYYIADIYIEDNYDWDSVVSPGTVNGYIPISTSAPLYTTNPNDLYNALSNLVGPQKAQNAKQKQSNNVTDPSKMQNPPTLVMPILNVQQQNYVLVTQYDRTIPINPSELIRGQIDPIDIKSPIIVKNPVVQVGFKGVDVINAPPLYPTKQNGYVGASLKPVPPPITVKLPTYQPIEPVQINQQSLLAQTPYIKFKPVVQTTQSLPQISIQYENNAGIPSTTGPNYSVQNNVFSATYNYGYGNYEPVITKPWVSSSGYPVYTPTVSTPTISPTGTTYGLPQNGTIIVNNSSTDVDVLTVRQNPTNILSNQLSSAVSGSVEVEQNVPPQTMAFSYSRPQIVVSGVDPVVVTATKKANNVVFINDGQFNYTLYNSSGSQVQYSVNTKKVYVIHSKGLSASVTLALLEAIKSHPGLSGLALALPFALFLVA